jgi:hypothetical protein
LGGSLSEWSDTVVKYPTFSLFYAAFTVLPALFLAINP